jgi:hypothetical protein
MWCWKFQFNRLCKKCINVTTSPSVIYLKYPRSAPNKTPWRQPKMHKSPRITPRSTPFSALPATWIPFASPKYTFWPAANQICSRLFRAHSRHPSSRPLAIRLLGEGVPFGDSRPVTVGEADCGLTRAVTLTTVVVLRLPLPNQHVILRREAT